jgi:ribonuclease HI
MYSDASMIPTTESTGIGIGFIALQYDNQGQPSTIHRNIDNIGQSQLVYNGELEGITQAIEYASTIAQPGQNYNIYADNQAALNRLKSANDNPGQSQQIRANEATLNAIEKGATIALNWVSGHTDIYGNDQADKLAKLATTIEPSTTTTSFAVLGCEAKKANITEWRNVLAKYDSKPSTNPFTYKKLFPWKIKSKIQLPRGTTRELASSLFQLKLGHGYIRSYLHKLGHVTSDKCVCGTKETAQHLLLSCNDPKLVLARSKLKNELGGNRLTMALLLHTTIGIEKTLAFLRETSVCTRRNHLNRLERELALEELGELEGEE